MWCMSTKLESFDSVPQRDKRYNNTFALTSGSPGPREHAAVRGIRSLSDVELIMLILGSGGPKGGVAELSARLLPIIQKNFPATMEPEAFEAVDGIGPAKASVFSASLEFARRWYGSRGKKIYGPSDVYPLIAHRADPRQEHFLVLPLNGAHEVLDVCTVSIGLVNRTVVHPREVFAPALEYRAAAVIVAHNHPSGNLEPSTEDHDVTRRLKSAGDLLGVPLLDHIVFSESGFTSFLDTGKLG